MGCEVCGQSLAGLAGGLISLTSFILISASQIFFASIKMIFEKVRLK